MNYFEEEVAKYTRRLRKIEGNPNPAMLQSNRLLYQAMLRHNEEQLHWWRERKPFLSWAGFGLGELMQCFGEYRPLSLVPIADRLAAGHAEACFQQVAAMGLPDYACDRTILFMPMAVRGEEIPKPTLIVGRNGGCNVVCNSHRTLAHLMGLPVFTVDVPFEDPHQDHLGYVVAQLKELIAFVETHLPGARYDEDRLVEWQRLMRRWFVALHDIHGLRQLVPCPDHPRDVFHEPHNPTDYAAPSLVVEYYESYRDELRSRATAGWTPVGEEKLRIVWTITGPYGSNIWDYLAKRGVSVPYWQYGAARTNFAMPLHGDVSEFGRKLSPLEETARTMLHNSWGGTGERWIEDTISVCKEFRADGVVQFEQTGCQPVLGVGQLLTDRLEKELGIPSWRVEGRMLLGHTERGDAEFMSGLEAFVDLCFERKRGR